MRGSPRDGQLWQGVMLVLLGDAGHNCETASLRCIPAMSKCKLPKIHGGNHG